MNTDYTISENDVWVVTPKIARKLGAPQGVFAHYGWHVWFWFTEDDEFIGIVITNHPEGGSGFSYRGKKGTWQIYVRAPDKPQH